MNKSQLADAIAEKSGVSRKEAEDMIEAFVDVVTTQLQQGESVSIAGFGAFQGKFRSKRMGVNPQNPSERIEIPAVTVPKFKAGKGLKDGIKHSHENQPTQNQEDTNVY